MSHMKGSLRVLAAGFGAVVLVACTPASAPPAPTAAPTSAATAPAGLTRSDAQGAVSFEVTPLNLDQPADTLDFAVTLSTHAEDLSWDLAATATLATDTGVQVSGTSWPIGSGHHVEGTLSFPARTADGRELLSGARALTLTIRDTDVPERTFVWDLAR